MVRPYRVPGNNDTIGSYEYFRYVNEVTGGLFFPVILLVIWLITFMGTKQFSNSRAWTIASFLTTTLSIPLAIMKLISPTYMYMSIFALAIGAVWLKLEGNR